MAGKFDRVGMRDHRIASIESHEIKELNQTFCPSCGAGPMDGVTGAQLEEVNPYLNDASIKHAGFQQKRVYPHNGSPTICAYCGELLVFRQVGDTLTLAYPTETELASLKSDHQAWQIIVGLQEKMKQHALEGRLKGDKRYAKSKPRRF